ncbi:MAG: hypothetical protein ACHQ49_10250 [Elusimicrobiota bacterium]
MNIMFASVGADPTSVFQGGSLPSTMAVEGFALIGLVLFLAGGRLCLRRRLQPHAAQYLSPRR